MVDLPKYVQIEPVGQCNLRCQMCPIQFRKDGPPYGPVAFMEFEHYQTLIDQFTDGGLTELHLQGLGEPMMHPRYFDMVEYAAKKGIRVTTNSNLTLVSAKRAELCVTSGLDTIRVSIDGAKAETYERIRVRSSLERVKKGLRLINEARARLGSDQPKLGLVVVAMRQNLSELNDLLHLASEYGMFEVFVQHLCHDFAESSLPEEYRPMRDYIDEQTLFHEEPSHVAEIFDTARETATTLGLTLRLPSIAPKDHPPGTPGRKRCDWPWSGAYVSYQGLAMPCCMISTPDRTNFGNMATEGVEAIWNSDDYQRFREQLDSETPPEICKSCALYRGTF